MTLERNPNTFANNPLNRAGRQRLDKAWVEARLRDTSSLIVPLWNLKPLIVVPKEAGAVAAIGWMRPGIVQDLVPPEALRVFLGLKEDIACFAADISLIDDPKSSGPLASIGKFIDLRSIAPDLDPGDAAILAQAKSLIDWHRRHGFCAVCGRATQLEEAGYKRQCPSCGAEHFPRTDPVVITLVVSGDQCLLGRGADWPQKMFSALAGFVEPGEAMEEAVAREVMEEVGVPVSKVRYVFSQPWPYPSSLMMACIAEAESEVLSIDSHEIAEAKWVSREAVVAALKGKGEGAFWLPPPMAIAHQLIRTWVFEGAEGRPEYDGYES